jgi:hypothetical protein
VKKTKSKKRKHATFAPYSDIGQYLPGRIEVQTVNVNLIYVHSAQSVLTRFESSFEMGDIGIKVLLLTKDMK